jgi:hypothetical protein
LAEQKSQRNPLSATQLAALNQLKETMPADAVPGFAVTVTDDSTTTWVSKMRQFSDDFKLNAYAYNNWDIKKGKVYKTNRKPSRIISPEGFPPGISVTYTSPPPYAYYSPSKVRELTHFVLHSFGHIWHASIQKGKLLGWMNQTSANKGVTAIQYEGKTIYVAKGSDPKTLAHFTRFAAGLQACTNSAAQATAHFFIDRNGNLVIIGDCNDILYTSNCMNAVSCGVELEEALYSTHDTKGAGNAVTWGAGGNPPGTAGNILYASYSIEQMHTLAILARKLETIYPQLRERNVQFDRCALQPGAPPGYTMHDYIYKGIDKVTGKALGGHIDVSPHFRTQDFWDAFFKTVDEQNQITKNNVFVIKTKYMDSGTQIKDSDFAASSNTSLAGAVVMGTKNGNKARQRADSIANATKSDINASTAANAIAASTSTLQQVTNAAKNNKAAQHLIVDYPSANIAYDSNGQQIGSDSFV